MSEPAPTVGWPRPRYEWRPSTDFTRCPQLPNKLPAPWINEPCIAARGDWHSFHVDAERAHTERLCLVCGEPLNTRIVLGAMGGERMTSGPGGHPRCMWLAVNTCPHLVERDEIVAWEYVGEGVGYSLGEAGLDDWGTGEAIVTDAMPLTRSELRAVAQGDPMGVLS